MDNAPNFKSQPANQNIAQPTRFKMVFARVPNLTFWCQSVIFPSLSTSYFSSPTPFLDQKIPGDKLVYEDLMVTMLVDEDLRSWREIHDWMRGFTFPTDFKEYRNLNKLGDILKHQTNARPQYSDLHIQVYNNNWQHILTWKFYDAFPIMLGQLSYSATDSPDSIMISDVTIAYQWFDIEIANASVA